MVNYACLPVCGVRRGTSRRRWLRLALLAVCFVPLLGLAGCGTATYNCAPNGCFDGVALNMANFGLYGTPWAVNSLMYVTTTRCDATCRASSGDANNPGSLSTFVLVGKDQYQIGLGYGTDAFGNQQFFLDFELPERPFTRYWLGPTGLNQDGSNAYYVHALIYGTFAGADGGCPPAAPMLWQAVLGFPDNAPNGGGGRYLGPVGGSDISAGCTAFVPDSLVLGQYLVGTSSAYAAYTYFAYNQYSTTLQYGDEPKFPTNFHYLSADGAVIGNGPPFVGWNTPPSKNTVAGGIFYIQCCAPPCGTLFC